MSVVAVIRTRMESSGLPCGDDYEPVKNVINSSGMRGLELARKPDGTVRVLLWGIN